LRSELQSIYDELILLLENYMANELIFIVDDDAPLRGLMKVLLEEQGYAVRDFEGGDAMIQALDDSPSLILLDVMMPGLSGQDTLKNIKTTHPDIPVVMLTSVDKVETAVEVIKLGAYDYLLKPVDETRLFTCLDKAFEQRSLVRKVRHLQSEVDRLSGKDGIIGKSNALNETLQKVQQVASSKASVLILGETGTGKELIARAVHRNSSYATGPFVDINCGAIPETLQESELFGHKKGAFTGATESRPGKLELADGGTLFLDEVAEMSLATQAKLLRFLQEKCLERVGDTQKIQVDTRVICATNKDLKALIEKGTFREDLYYRLAVFPIEVPSLRDRAEDIPLLCSHFLKKYQEDIGKEIQSISDEAMQVLQEYSWPGNIRQLENTLYQAMIVTSYDTIDADCLPEDVFNSPPPTNETEIEEPANTSITPYHEVVKQTLKQALDHTDGHIPNAAKVLGISRSTFYRMLKKYQLD
jgi:DNA-binding NtrC family response regulator